jgi:hypothetical protein
VTAEQASTVAPAATPTTLHFEGPTQADYEPDEKHLELAAGDYRLAWRAIGPFVDRHDGYGAICTMNLGLYDSTGSYAGGVADTSQQVATPQGGEIVYRGLAAGAYSLTVYNSCAWSVDIGGIGDPIPTGAPSFSAAPPSFSVSAAEIRAHYSEWHEAVAHQLAVYEKSKDKLARANAMTQLGYEGNQLTDWLDAHPDISPANEGAIAMWRRVIGDYDDAARDTFVGLTTGDRDTYARGVDELSAARRAVSNELQPAIDALQ